MIRAAAFMKRLERKIKETITVVPTGCNQSLDKKSEE